MKQIEIQASTRVQHWGGIGLLCLAGLLGGCSERDSLPPETSIAEPGTLDLELEIRISNAGEVSRLGQVGDALDLDVRIYEEGKTADVAILSQQLSAETILESLEIELPGESEQRYLAEVRVIGSRVRSTGTTEVGLVHLATSKAFQIFAQETTIVPLILEDLVPQLWMFEALGVAHELKWSPVAGALSYNIFRTPDGEAPTLYSAAGLDTSFAVPPGFSSPGSLVEYRIQSVFDTGVLSAFSESQIASDPGSVPPGAVTDLSTFELSSSEVVLQWTAPGDDGFVGQAARYDLRRSLNAITETNFDEADPVLVDSPSLPGQMSFAVSGGFIPEEMYFFSLVTFDEAGNRSELSNPLSILVPLADDVEAPTTILDLTAISAEEGLIDLRWSAPSDQRDGGAAEYDLRYAVGSLTEDSFAAATAVVIESPKSPGSPEHFAVSDLPPASYSFAIRSRDLAGNVSSLSQIVSVESSDTVAPDVIADLSAESRGEDVVRLRWTASGDNGRTRRAARLDLRVATFALTEANFADGTVVETTPPNEPGISEEHDLAGLRAETTYYFVAKTVDEVENRSAISNLVEFATDDFEAPSRIEDLVAEEVTGTRAKMFWTAPGDNMQDGIASSYDLRFSTEPITAENFSLAQRVENMPDPSEAVKTRKSL